jgi:polyisoprenoid-binding protein YceI
MATTNWKIDPTHSELTFKVKHLMVSNVSGQFESFDGNFETEGDNFNNAKINFTADIDSINTRNADRDTHLKSGDFFDAEKFPKMSFVATDSSKLGEDEFTLTGDLTIRDVTKSVTLKGEFGGVGQDPWGNTKAGFTITGKFNRKDFGLNWNAALETGGVLVSDEVKVNAEVQLVKA